MPKILSDGRIKIESGDTLYGIYGSNWKELSGYTGDPTKLQVGAILPAVKGKEPEKKQEKTKETPEETTEETPEEKPKEKTTPKWLAENEQYLTLTPEEQEYMTNYYNVLAIQDEESQNILAKALQDAKDMADPYFAEQIRMAQDELSRAMGQQTDDFASNKRDLELRIEQIDEDLTTGKERLGVDEQAELSRQKRKYEVNLEGLIENAASRGLTFSSKRALAESRLSTEQSDIVESTKRGFQRQISDLQQAASRGEVGAQNLLEDYERTYGESVTSLIRTAEQTLGTENLPSDLPELPGISPLGGVVGGLEEDKQSDIIQRAKALAELRNPFL